MGGTVKDMEETLPFTNIGPPQYEYAIVPLEEVIPPDEKDIKHLEKSMTLLGVFDSVVLIQTGAKYRVIAGKRTVSAAMKSGQKKIPAVIVPEEASVYAPVITVLENIARKPNPADEATNLQKIMDSYHLDEKGVAELLGIRLTTVKNRLSLLGLIPPIFTMLRNGEISLGLASRVAKLSVKQQERLLEAGVTQKGYEEIRKGQLSGALESLFDEDGKEGNTPPADEETVKRNTLSYLEAMASILDSSSRLYSAIRYSITLIKKERE
jgi:ParB/RepB/Spo0J family partition protein